MATLNRELAKELSYRSVGSVVEGYVIVENKIIETTRWDVVYNLVVEKDGKLLETSYFVGATESQDYGAFDDPGGEYDPLAVEEFIEVIPYAKYVVDYRPA